MMTQVDDVKRAIVEAIEERDVRGGIMTIDFFETKLREHHHELERMIQIGLQEATTRRLDGGPLGLDNPNGHLGVVAQQEELDNGQIYPFYCYGGRFWHSPKGWKFSTRTYRRAGWSLWLNGQPGIIRPFRLLDPRTLSPDKKVRSTLKLMWRPIFQMMERAPGLNIPRRQELPMDFVEASYALATEYLRTRAGYIWEKCKRPEMLCVSSWSKRVLRSNIEKFGNELDLQNLPPPQRCNNPHRHRRQRQHETQVGDGVLNDN